LKALSTAANKADQLELADLAFESRYIHPIRNYHQELESAKIQQNQAMKQLANLNKQLSQITEKTRLYLTHFVQVLNMCITREEFSPETRKFYGIEPNDRKTPKMSSNQDLYKFGKQIIEGEDSRIRLGGNPILNPTIGKVKVWFDQFKDLYHSQQVSNKTYQRASQQLIEIRRKVDIVLPLVWNEIEEHFAELDENERRTQCQEYGIVYVYRKNEQKPT
jgi:hypothetical protein